MASKTSSTTTRYIIAPALLNWFAEHGRHDLPWQSPRDAYRVWVSEIMLQQTQVSTVIPYFERFMQAFKTLTELANAPIDTVLHYWTGLGYYARARNLHKAAQQIRDLHAGRFPDDYESLLALPGIGRSTAGAILAQAFGLRYPILDGNVKRVLTRLYAIEGWPGNKAVEQELWKLAEANTPQQNVVDYTQAIMDLGATLCKRGSPNCPACPLSQHCQAYAGGRQCEFPTPKPKKSKPIKQTRMLIITDENGRTLLEQRPPAGIWGGLWSFPECEPGVDPGKWCHDELKLRVATSTTLQPLRHTFSHYHLDIEPVLVQLSQTKPDIVMDSERLIWYNMRQPDQRGLPAPIKTLLETLAAGDGPLQE